MSIPRLLSPSHPSHRVFKRGAKPSHRHKLAGATPHRITGGTPTQVIVVPSFLEMWLNDTYGDCVTAEEAFAKAAFSVFCGLPETKITDATVLAFCNKYDFLNGANLTDVMDKMISDGFIQDNGYKDGPYSSIDYSNEPVLQNALSQGTVKIGIDANALPSGAGNGNGWYAAGGHPQQFTNEDHCVALTGYGPVAALFAALNTPVPAGFPANGYLLYTWSSIGVVDHAWIMSTVGEAWLRNPTTVGVSPIPTPPTPVPPIPVPTPPPSPGAITLTTTIDPVAYTITVTGPTGYTVNGSSPSPVVPTERAGLMAMTSAALNLVPTQYQDANWQAAKTKVAQGSVGTISFNFLAVIMAAMKLFSDVTTGNLTAITADIAALLAAFTG